MSDTELDLDQAAMAANGVSEDDVKRLLDTFGPEPLNADLVPFLAESRLGGQGLFHPLIHDPFYNEAMNKQINKMYVAKTEALERYIEEEKWGSFVFIHERPYRFDALESVLFEHDVRDPEVIWPLVANIWTDSENINQNLEGWREIWDIDIPRRVELVMDETERAAFDALPETIPVYRGIGHEDAVEGMSWTTNRKKAEWFAYRFCSMRDGLALLAVGSVAKKDVLAHFLGRNEYEIVALPELVTIEKTTRLPVRKPKRG